MEKNWKELSFREKLAASPSSLCLGMDMHPVETAKGPLEWGCYMYAVMARLAGQKIPIGAIKPNLGFYEAMNKPRDYDKHFRGFDELEFILKQVNGTHGGHELLMNTITIGDAKRGDIGKSSENYAKDILHNWDFDAITVSPYMGDDSVLPFLKDQTKGAYVLCLTSNPGSNRLQTKPMGVSGFPLYLHVAEWLTELTSQFPNVGAVVGISDRPESVFHFQNVIAQFADTPVPLLIPGAGTQGGSVPEIIRILRRYNYPMHLVRINSSSGLTHPWDANNIPVSQDVAADLCVAKIIKTNDEIEHAKAA